MNFHLNLTLLLHAFPLREVRSLQFRKMLHHFIELDFSPHCQRLFELVFLSFLPWNQCIICSISLSNFSQMSLVWQKGKSVQVLTTIKLSFLRLREKEWSFTTMVIFNARTEWRVVMPSGLWTMNLFTGSSQNLHYLCFPDHSGKFLFLGPQNAYYHLHI